MQVSLIEILRNMALPVQCVVGVLTLQAIACVAVALDRLVLLSRSTSQARAFAMEVQSAMEAAAYKAVLESAALYKGNHFASYLELGLLSFMKRQGVGDEGPRAAEFARRALQRKGDAINRDLASASARPSPPLPERMNGEASSLWASTWGNEARNRGARSPI